MRKVITAVLFAAITFGSFGVTVPVAEAGICSGPCEQFRRTCLFDNKLLFDRTKVQCLEAGAQCGLDCEAEFSGRPLKACKRVCHKDSLLCRRQAFADSRTGRDACDLEDIDCQGVCDMYTDRLCARQCGRSGRSCYKAVKDAKESCFHACRTAEKKPKGCKSACRLATSEANAACSDTMFTCWVDCP